MEMDQSPMQAGNMVGSVPITTNQQPQSPNQQDPFVAPIGLPPHFAAVPETPSSVSMESAYCRLVNFEIEKKIGRGQFSVVYRARCKSNNQVVALKKVQVLICASANRIFL